MKWEIPGKGRNSPNYGYYMLLIIAAPDVRDHLSDREVSTVLFLPASIGSMVGELPRALYISGQWIFTNIQECSKSSLMLISAKRFSSKLYLQKIGAFKSTYIVNESPLLTIRKSCDIAFVYAFWPKFELYLRIATQPISVIT